VTRPATVMIRCADGAISVTGITWSRWWAYGAEGNGTVNVNDCQPTCAAGHTEQYPGSVYVFGGLVTTDGEIFQNVTVTPTGPQGKVQSSYTAGAWGVP
jgi:hypothetical protein